MPAESSRAVFLSYASQDAEAARRICETLRSSGVEVWFDADGGLEHGDEWDAKIRRQIKECVLFIPVISANTQAREEGYFRIEWELAAQRALGIASGVPFILPVVIDDTREPEALVPDRFRVVQWTRLRGGEVSPDVKQRFLKLWSHRAGVLKHAAQEVAQASSLPSAPETGRKPALPPVGRRVPAAAWITAVVAVAAIVGFIALRPASPAVSPSKPPTPEKSATPPSEARQLAEKARALFEALDCTRDDFKLAEELLAEARTKAPMDAEVTATEAHLHQRYVIRGWDVSDARRESARAAVQRAIRLDPRSFDARVAQASLLADTGRDGAEKERQLRELRAERPTDKRVLRMLASVIDRLGRMDEAAVIADESAALPGGDPLALYSKSLGFWFAGRTVEAETAIQASLAQRSFAGALMMAAWYRIALHADLDGARSFISRIEPGQMIEDRAAYFAFYLEFLAHRSDAAIARLRAVPRDWLNDFWYRGPKGWLVGGALDLAGSHDAAIIEYTAALKLVEQRLAASPSNPALIYNRIGLLVCLGRREEAERQLAVLRQMNIAVDISSSGAIAKCYALLGHKAEAIKGIAASLKRTNHAVTFPSGELRLDPIFDALRGEPEFAKLIAEAEAAERASGPAAPKSSLTTTAPPTADEKSVAVLPFVNGSGDKGDEPFSDGLSEELINALLKVPGLKVPASTSSFHFKGKDTPLAEIARQLNVAHVVEGNVRKVGTRVRITAKLIKAADGFPVWSSGNIDLDRELKDVLALQEEIAGRIASALQLKLVAPTAAATVNPEAYGWLLQGRFAARQESNTGRQQSIEFYRRAVGLEPGYALAWAEMAQSYIRLARFGALPTTDGMKEARLAAQKSLDLDPDQPIALDAMGWVQRTADWDWRTAQKTFQRALAFAPENAAILADAAVIYYNVGRTDEAIALARQAAERDPLNAMAQINLGDLMWNSNRLTEGVDQMGKGIQLAPGIEEFRTHLAIALAQLKRFPEAVAMAEAEPNAVYRLFGRGFVASLRGDHLASAQARDELVAKHGASMTGYIAMLYCVAGNRDEAFAWLERGYRERDSSVCWIKTAFVYTDLRSDPRWPILLRKLGLADDQLK